MKMKIVLVIAATLISLTVCANEKNCKCSI